MEVEPQAGFRGDARSDPLSDSRSDPEGSAWAPGLRSDIPHALRPLITLFRAEHAFVEHAEASELSDFCGLGVLELMSLRPERLVVHELLVRVTADLSVPDGPGYETLGLNLRAMVAVIHERYVAKAMPEIVAAFESERTAATRYVALELAEQVFEPASDAHGATFGSASESAFGSASARVGDSFAGRWFGRLFAKAAAKDPPRAEAESDAPRELCARAAWQARLDAGVENGLHRACLEGLVVVIDAIVGHRGRLPSDAGLITRLVVNRVCTGEHGSRLIGALVEPVFLDAIAREGFRPLPGQHEPVVLNVKGASASGKSTIRPQQREFVQRLGLAWEDFALISPDYWRKYLLDYSTLGQDYKYGAMLTGSELELIDRKLDRYMADKAAAGRISHLLIDRFRFDSFTLLHGRTADSGLLSRFGRKVYMYFMVTPPAETVERAWIRGQSTGRYKAVDDLLFHNVEAFTGMPALFLSWVGATDRDVHFEFLDNDVPKGELPRTVAFGRNGSMTILDVGKMLDIDRYRKVNVDAQAPDEIFDTPGQAIGASLGFVRRCAEDIDELMFADGTSASVYAHFLYGSAVWWDDTRLAALPIDDERRVVLQALGCTDGRCRTGTGAPALDAPLEHRFTLGRWP